MNKVLAGTAITCVTALSFIIATSLPLKNDSTPKAQTSPNNNTHNIQAEQKVYITYYGWSDNDPPGTEIAYPKVENPKTIHEKAGGIGTYSDPVTFAADPKVFATGTMVYVPYIKKYAIMEDWCAGCIGNNHIDIWAGGNGNNKELLIKCEENATRDSEEIIINPDPNLDTDKAPIFDSATTSCRF